MRASIIWAVAAMGIAPSIAAAAPLVFVAASHTPLVDVAAVRRQLVADGFELVAPAHGSEALDVLVLLVESPTRATAYARTAEGLHIRALTQHEPSGDTRWLVLGVRALMDEVSGAWCASALRDPWRASAAWTTLGRVRDGIVDPWFLTSLSERVDAPAVADPWR